MQSKLCDMIWSFMSRHDLHLALRHGTRFTAPPCGSPPSTIISNTTLQMISTRRPLNELTHHMAPAGGFTIMNISYIKLQNHITSHGPCKIKLDASTLSLQVLRGF